MHALHLIVLIVQVGRKARGEWLLLRRVFLGTLAPSNPYT
jgi:hypothetical protein